MLRFGTEAACSGFYTLGHVQGLIQSHRFALYAVVYDVQLRSENVTLKARPAMFLGEGPQMCRPAYREASFITCRSSRKHQQLHQKSCRRVLI